MAVNSGKTKEGKGSRGNKMSMWYDIQDMKISEDGKRLQMYIMTNNEGNVYAEAKIDDILEVILKRNKPNKQEA